MKSLIIQHWPCGWSAMNIFWLDGNNICHSYYFLSTKRHSSLSYNLVGILLLLSFLNFCWWPRDSLFVALVRGYCPFYPQLFSLECAWTEACLFLAALYSLGFPVNTLKGQCGQMALSQNTRQFSLAVTWYNLSPPYSAENWNQQKLSGDKTSLALLSRKPNVKNKQQSKLAFPFN